MGLTYAEIYKFINDFPKIIKVINPINQQFTFFKNPKGVCVMDLSMDGKLEIHYGEGSDENNYFNLGSYRPKNNEELSYLLLSTIINPEINFKKID